MIYPLYGQCPRCIWDKDWRDNEGEQCVILLEGLLNLDPVDWQDDGCIKFEPERWQLW